MKQWAWIIISILTAACGGEGGGGGTATPSSSGGDGSNLPAGCLTVGSIANTGGPITIIATCTSGTGTEQQVCFTQGVQGEPPVTVPCDNGSPIFAPTPTTPVIIVG
jgi:hypothetical protein